MSAPSSPARSSTRGSPRLGSRTPPPTLPRDPVLTSSGVEAKRRLCATLAAAGAIVALVCLAVVGDGGTWAKGDRFTFGLLHVETDVGDIRYRDLKGFAVVQRSGEAISVLLALAALALSVGAAHVLLVFPGRCAHLFTRHVLVACGYAAPVFALGPWVLWLAAVQPQLQEVEGRKINAELGYCFHIAVVMWLFTLPTAYFTIALSQLMRGWSRVRGGAVAGESDPLILGQ